MKAIAMVLMSVLGVVGCGEGVSTQTRQKNFDRSYQAVHPMQRISRLQFDLPALLDTGRLIQRVLQFDASCTRTKTAQNTTSLHCSQESITCDLLFAHSGNFIAWDCSPDATYTCTDTGDGYECLMQRGDGTQFTESFTHDWVAVSTPAIQYAADFGIDCNAVANTTVTQCVVGYDVQQKCTYIYDSSYALTNASCVYPDQNMTCSVSQTSDLELNCSFEDAAQTCSNVYNRASWEEETSTCTDK